jgi:hypothetical protein
MAASPRPILVLYWHPESTETMRAAVSHHLRALDTIKGKRQILYYNALKGAPAWLRHLHFDAVILHTTFLCLRWSHLFYTWKWRLRWIKDLDCVKIALPQDEYDHSEILDEWLFEWGVSVVFTTFDASQRKVLYPIMYDKAHFYECFTGYIDDATAQRYAGTLAPLEARPYDIVYRATHLPYWFGSHGQLKHRLAEVIAQRAKAHGVKCDISTRVEDTIVGDRWLDFLASGRAVIGCESGSSVLDRRGEIKAQIQAMLRADPTLSFEVVSARMPDDWDDYQFFALSPRHFEAVITKTCQILIEGSYQGVFESDKHYIPLKRDFSNIGEVLEKTRDHQFIKDMVDRAYNDIYLSRHYTYKKLATDIETAFSEERTHGQHTVKLMDRIMWGLGRLAGYAVIERIRAEGWLKRRQLIRGF